MVLHLKHIGLVWLKALIYNGNPRCLWSHFLSEPTQSNHLKRNTKRDRTKYPHYTGVRIIENEIV